MARNEKKQRPYLFVEAVGRALLATRMALAADGLAGQRFEWALLLRTDPFVVVAVRTGLGLLEAALLQYIQTGFSALKYRLGD